MEDYLFLSLLLSGFISFTLVSADQYPEIDQREDRGRTGDQLDYIYQDPDTEEMVQISLDEIVEFGEPSQIQTSLGDLTNLTFLPLPGEIREKENNKTISMTQEQITNSVLEKIQALLDAAGRNQTLEDILDILPKQVLDIPVHRQPQNHVKHPQDIFGELIASMEKYQGSENSSNLSVQYPEEQNSSFINLKFVLGTPDLENSEPNLENLEPYLETEPIIQDEDLPNLIEGDSEELIGNLDYTDTTDELKELFKNLRTRPGPSQLTEASLTRLTKPYTTRTPYRPGGSLRFDSTPSPTGEHGSTLASPGSTLTTQPSSDITFTDGLSFNPQYSPLKPAFPELLRYLLTENDLSSLMDRDIVQNQIDDSPLDGFNKYPGPPQTRDNRETGVKIQDINPNQEDNGVPDEKKDLHLVSNQANYDQKLEIKTSSGRILGKWITTSQGTQIQGYLGIPYAQAPLGELRFEAPRPPVEWEGIRNATSSAPSCWTVHAPNSWESSGTGMSEDCLYLSIWVPETQETRLSVMVWLTVGRGQEDKGGEELSAEGNLVVVKVESRRGALGFLATQEKSVPGNAGMLDQIMALRWIQTNIDLFKGNPEKVTLLGYGKGADLSSLHLVSPLSCSLYRNLILQSGSTFTHLISRHQADERARSLASLLNCATLDDKTMLSCLRSVDAQVLTNQEFSAVNLTLHADPFPPIIDGLFAVENPGSLVEENLFKKSNLLIGTNSNEVLKGLMEFLPELNGDSVKLELSSLQLDSALNRIFPRYPESVLSLIKFQYGLFEENSFARIQNDPRRFWGLQAAVADKEVVCGVNKLAKTVSNDGNKVFRYFFDNDASDLESGKEMNLLFGEPLVSLGRRNSDTEINLSKKMIKFWTNFAKFDDPNGDMGSGEERVWPEFSAPNWSYVNVNTENLEVGEDLRGRVCVFWEQILPGFLPRTESELKERSGRNSDSSCRAVKSKANLYFPGYRPVNRL